MATPTELFINSELPKRPYTNQFPLEAGHIPVATGNGLEVAARALTTSDISGMSSYATQQDLSNVLAGLWDDRGAYTVNAAGNINYPSSAGSGVAGAIMKGDIFTVAGAVAGVSTINNIAVNNGDTVRALVDNPSATDNAHWAIAENNIGYVPENTANKTTNTDLSGVAGTYPDTPTVKSYIDKYDISAASINSTGTVTLTRTASNLTFQVPTAISGLSFDPNTGILTSSYTNNATSTTITVAANEVADNVFRIKDNTDATKKIAFEASAVGTGQTRTITMPDANVDLGNVAQAASTSTTGYLTSTDWNTFNGKKSLPEVKSASFTAEINKAYSLGTPTTTLNIQFPTGTVTGQEIITHINRAALTYTVSAVAAAGQHVVYVGAGTYQIASGFCDHILRWVFNSSNSVWEVLEIVPAGSITDVIAFCSSVNIQSRLKLNLPTATGTYNWYTPAKNINFGDLPSVATTNGNSISGTAVRCRILGGQDNTVSGINNIGVNSTNCIINTGNYNTAIRSENLTIQGNYCTSIGSVGGEILGEYVHSSYCTNLTTTATLRRVSFHNVEANQISSTSMTFAENTEVVGSSAGVLTARCAIKGNSIGGVGSVLTSINYPTYNGKPLLCINGGLSLMLATHKCVLFARRSDGTYSDYLILRFVVNVSIHGGTPIITTSTESVVNPTGLSYSFTATKASGTYEMDLKCNIAGTDDYLVFCYVDSTYLTEI